VAQSDNYAELPELARLLAPLGIYFLGVNPLHHFRPEARTTTTTPPTVSGVERSAFEAAVARPAGSPRRRDNLPELRESDFEWPRDFDGCGAGGAAQLQAP
jgi:hypothetical protein